MSVFIKSFIPAILVMAFAVSPIHGAAKTNPLAQLIQSRYADLQSFDANFEQTLTHKESGSTEKRKGQILFHKPMLIRWETAKPHEEVLVVTNKEIWDYLPDEDLAYRYSPTLARDSRSIIQVLTGQSALTRDFDVKSSGKENGQEKLVLYPKEPTTQMVEAVIWVDPDSGFIRRAKIVDFYGNSNDVRFTNFQPDASISANRFSFKPPKGVEVEDLRNSASPDRELFK